MPENSLVVIQMNDRLGRRLVLNCDHYQRCVVAAWIEEDATLAYPDTDRQIDNCQLYEDLFD